MKEGRKKGKKEGRWEGRKERGKQCAVDDIDDVFWGMIAGG